MTATKATSPSSCSRRALLSGTAGAACAFTLAACGGDGGDGAADESPAPPAEEPGTGDGDGGGDATGDGAEVAALADVPVGEAVAVTGPDGEDALLFRPDEETVVAYSAVCTHKGGTLQPDGAELRCPLHQSVFDAATGEVVNGPATEALPAVAVRVEGDRIVAG